MIIESQSVFGLGVIPSYIDVGEITQGDMHLSSFEVINRFNYPMPINITFELTHSSSYLKENVIFFPSSTILYPQNKSKVFNVLIMDTEHLSIGNHFLVFRPYPIPLEDAALNSSQNITVASYIMQTSAFALNFDIVALGGIVKDVVDDASASTSMPSDSMMVVQTTEEVVKNIDIIYPSFFKVAHKNESVIITVKNEGDFNFTNLTIRIITEPFFTVEYNSTIGTLFLGEEKKINLNMSGFSSTYHYVKMVVSDGVDEWVEASMIVYVPDISRAAVLYDCIVFEPQDIKIKPNTETSIRISVFNNCDIALNNVNVIISNIVTKNIGVLNPKNTSIVEFLISQTEIYKEYPISFIYDEGESAGVLRVSLENGTMQIIFILFVFLLLIVGCFYAYKQFRKRKPFISKRKNDKYFNYKKRLRKYLRV
ncbi:hypothetical protein GQ473_01905 [archaeon]|nr:hypothetical protein [archaeon]